jgi:hypothetical protein
MENSCARYHVSAWSCGLKGLLERKRDIPAGTKQNRNIGRTSEKEVREREERRRRM